MATPRRKSVSRKYTRRAHDALTPINLATCHKCGAHKLQHCACESCGAYKDIVLPKRFLQTNLNFK